MAVIRSDGSAEVWDTPVVLIKVGKTTRRRADADGIAQLMKTEVREGSNVFIEAAQPHAANGKQGWYGSGYGYGIWRGVIAGRELKSNPVTANRWKRDLELTGKGKDCSRALAAELYPEMSPHLRAVKHHGRAEALLLAHWGITFKDREEQRTQGAARGAPRPS